MLIVICGASASGKTTLAKYLEKKYNIKRVVTTTTRDMREGEVDGVDYNFISHEEALESIKNNEFLEYVEYKVKDNRTWIYGTKKTDINPEITSLIILNPIGYREFKKNFGGEMIGVYVKPNILKRLYYILKRDKGDLKQALIRLYNDFRDFKNFNADIVIRDISNLIKD